MTTAATLGYKVASSCLFGLQEICDVADYFTANVPQMWLCLAELISPALHEGGISMAELSKQIKTLVPVGHAGLLLAHVLTLLSNSIRDIAVMWKDSLHSSVDVCKFVSEG